MRIALWLIVIVLLGMIAVRFVPYGRDHTNPAVVHEYPWRSPEAQGVARGACYDCHSNETVWPWYASLAPASWLVQRDVHEGRDHLNFSEWPQGSAVVTRAIGERIAEVVRTGEMPPRQYRLLHGDARLSERERRLLIDEFGTSP